MRFEKLVAFLKVLEERVGYKFTVEKFEDRLKLQKIVYIARYFDINMGYPFDLYLRGPYSRELADDYYFIDRELNGKLPEISKGLMLKIGGDERVLKFTELLRKYDDLSMLELISTLLIYMEKRSMNPLKLTPEEESHIIEVTHNMKPYFSKIAIKEALNIIKNEIVSS